MRIHRPAAAAALMLLAASLAGCAATSATTPPAGVRMSIAQPRIPDRTINVRDHGALGDGVADDGAAIQAALDAAAQAGGGRVVVPAGTYLVGPIDLRSRVALHLDAGATLRFSDDFDRYPIGTFKSLPTRHRPLIAAENLTDVAVTGSGTFEGNGKRWWDDFLPHKREKGYVESRPKMLCLESCRRVLIQGVTLQNAPMFHMSPTHCSDVTIDGVTVRAPAKSPNTDSCNPSGWNYEIKNCTFDVGDDNVAVKPFDAPGDGRASVENLFIHDCTFKHGHGLSVGGQTPGGLRNMHVWRCTFEDTDNGIRFKSARGDGGVVENVSFTDITMRRVRTPINVTSYYFSEPKSGTLDPARPVNDKTPVWRDIRIARLNATDCGDAGQITGLPEMPVKGLVLEDVRIGSARPMSIANAEVTMRNVEVVLVSKHPLATQPASQPSTTPASATQATTMP